MKTITKLGNARPFWLPCQLNIDMSTNKLGFFYQYVMSNMTINKQNVHYTNVHFGQPAGLHMAWNIREWQTEHTDWPSCPLLYTSVPQTGSSLRIW